MKKNNPAGDGDRQGRQKAKAKARKKKETGTNRQTEKRKGKGRKNANEKEARAKDGTPHWRTTSVQAKRNLRQSGPHSFTDYDCESVYYTASSTSTAKSLHDHEVPSCARWKSPKLSYFTAEKQGAN